MGTVTSAAYRKCGWGGQTEFPKLGGRGGVYDVLTFQSKV